MKLAKILATVVVVCALSGNAFAVTTNIAFTDSFGDAGDILLTTAVPPGPHPLGGELVTAISGSVFSAGVSSTITGLESPGTFGNDNLLFIDAPFFDPNGIAFDLDLGFGTLPFLLSSAGLSVCVESGCIGVISSTTFGLKLSQRRCRRPSHFSRAGVRCSVS